MNKCECCETTEGVYHVIDPYDQDVNNTVRWCYLCKICEQIRCDDI